MFFACFCIIFVLIYLLTIGCGPPICNMAVIGFMQDMQYTWTIQKAHMYIATDTYVYTYSDNN